MEEGGRGRPGARGASAWAPGIAGIRRGPGAHVRDVCCGRAALRRPRDPPPSRGPARALLPRPEGGRPCLLRGPLMPLDAPGVMLAFAASSVVAQAEQRGSTGTQDQPYFR